MLLQNFGNRKNCIILMDFGYRGFRFRGVGRSSTLLGRLSGRQSSRESLGHASDFVSSRHSIFRLNCNEKSHTRFSSHPICHPSTIL